MSKVFVLDTNKQPFTPCTPRRARLLLTRGKAAVFRRYPFTIILKRAIETPQSPPLRLKIDPGSKTTGLAIVNDVTGFEVREYVLEKFHRRCAYCQAENIPLELEHIVPKSRGGSDRVGNLTLACRACNQQKGDQTAEEFGHPQVHAQAKAPLKDAAAVNTTRWALYERLQNTGLPLEAGTGERTKYNRTRQDLPKMHWLDAACVGQSTPPCLRNWVSSHYPRTLTGITQYNWGAENRCKHDQPPRGREL